MAIDKSYETAFLNEISEGGLHLMCQVEDVGNIPYSLPLGDHGIFKVKRTASQLICVHCRREQPRNYRRPEIGILEEHGVTNVYYKYGRDWTYGPCTHWQLRCINSQNKELKIIAQQCKYQQHRTWIQLLEDMWNTAVRLDLKILDSHGRVSHAPLDKPLIQAQFGRRIINQSEPLCSCLVL